MPRATKGTQPAGTKSRKRTAADKITVTVDLSTLTWGDLETIEELAGHPIGKELQAGEPRISTMRALIVWKRRQTDPKFTIGPNDRVTGVDVEVRGKAKPDPTRGRG